ncbi:MAG: response regulator transcription factor [Runella sp.]
MTSLLLLEDDPVLSKETSTYLQQKGFTCDCVFDGEMFFRQIRSRQYDLFLLDINVPKLNGLEVCRRIRETDVTTPILMLTAYADIQDKTDAFGLGADDYLTKPFHLDELLLRVTSLLRRSHKPQEKDEILTVEDLIINLTEQRVTRSGQVIELTPREYQLMVFLAKAHGRIVSKQSISDNVWDIHFDTQTNTIEVYINFLRKKIDRNFPVKLIHTRPGFGYYLKKEA